MFSLKSVKKNDLLRDRAEIFKIYLENNLSGYQKIYKDVRNGTKQTKYFLKPLIAEKDQSDSGSSSDFERTSTSKTFETYKSNSIK